jgi:amino acid adenylation domain-containing protein
MGDLQSAISTVLSSTAWWTPGEAASDPNGPVNRPVPKPSPMVMERPIFAGFAAIASAQPDRIAVSDEAGSMTYAGLRARASGLAAVITRATTPGAAVAIFASGQTEIAIGILACFAAGRVSLLLNPEHPQARIDAILDDAAPEAAILDPGASRRLPVGVAAISVDASGEGDDVSVVPAAVDDPAIVVYTSGSTGRPKGIVRSQRQMLHRALNKVTKFRLDPSDRILSLYPLHSGPGVTAALAALSSGAGVHVMQIAALGARAALAAVKEHGITVIHAMPPLLRVLLQLPGSRDAFAGVRAIYTTSDSTLRSDLDAWRQVLPTGCVIGLGYGLSEGAPLIGWFLPAHPPGDEARLPVGYPVAAHDFLFADPSGQPVPPGEIGELWVRGRLLSLGEWQGGRVVPGRMIADPADPSRSILRTGDLLRLRPDGLVEYAGRVDAMIKIRGHRVEPAEIEDALRRDSEVADVAVVAQRSDGDARLVAFVVPHRKHDSGFAESLAHRLSGAVPSYMVPSRIELLAALPRLPGGKVDLVALGMLIDRPKTASSGGRLRRFLGLRA